MEFFRSENGWADLTADDRHEVFMDILHGDGDLTADVLRDLIKYYGGSERLAVLVEKHADAQIELIDALAGDIIDELSDWLDITSVDSDKHDAVYTQLHNWLRGRFDEDEGAEALLSGLAESSSGGYATLYVLTMEDAEMVLNDLGFRPTKGQLDEMEHRIRKGVEWGLGECWRDVMDAACEEAWREIHREAR